MELSPEQRKQIYEEEREREKVRSQIEAQKNVQKGKNTLIGCLTVFGILILLWLIGSHTMDTRKTSNE